MPGGPLHGGVLRTKAYVVSLTRAVAQGCGSSTAR